MSKAIEEKNPLDLSLDCILLQPKTEEVHKL